MICGGQLHNILCEGAICEGTRNFSRVILSHALEGKGIILMQNREMIVLGR